MCILANWEMNEGFGNLVHDSSGNGYDGKIHKGEWVEGKFGKALKFKNSKGYIEVDIKNACNGIRSMSIGGWFYSFGTGSPNSLMPQKYSGGVGKTGWFCGEEPFFYRGGVVPQKDWVSFFLGINKDGYLSGVINGQVYSHEPYVTLSKIGENAWYQLVVVKEEDGVTNIYQNGELVGTTMRAFSPRQPLPFIDKGKGPPVILRMPFGGMIGEAWIYKKSLTPEEIKDDYHKKKIKYSPSAPGVMIMLREMGQVDPGNLWPKGLTRQTWQIEREKIKEKILKILGPFPKKIVPLEPEIISEEDIGTYIRKKIKIKVEEDDTMPFYLLIPKDLSKPSPAIICIYGSTKGSGKERVVGLAGKEPGSPPLPNSPFAIDFVEQGFITVSADYDTDGERVWPGLKPYDTTGFYKKHPEWSQVGKLIWDNMRLIDYLETLDIIDTDNIGITGHSFGGHGAIFTGAFDERIKAVAASGAVSTFHLELHWARRGKGEYVYIDKLRPYLLNEKLPMPFEFYHFQALIAPRALLNFQSVAEYRPTKEINYAAVKYIYKLLGCEEKVKFLVHSGGHDYPPEARHTACDWFKRMLK
ncbi:acetylxylan esterase [Candidatus Calescamantes bacterium]|nr:acetylxylan esterase [Candidatus Calescamantes bacterium]